MGDLDFTHVYGPSPYQPLLLLVVMVLPWLLLETRRSRRHEAALRAAGAIEPADDVIGWMRVAYPGMFVAMTLEGLSRAPDESMPHVALAAGLAVFAAAKALKWWAILSLGRFWSFNVLVVPGATLVTSGPYRFLRHPNYVAVLGEIAGTALMMRAHVSGLLSAVVFGALLVARIRVEERMLREVAR